MKFSAFKIIPIRYRQSGTLVGLMASKEHKQETGLPCRESLGSMESYLGRGYWDDERPPYLKDPHAHALC